MSGRIRDMRRNSVVYAGNKPVNSRFEGYKIVADGTAPSSKSVT